MAWARCWGVAVIAKENENERGHVPLLKKLGPGLITGAATTTRAAIATYSQAGAQFGLRPALVGAVHHAAHDRHPRSSARASGGSPARLAANVREHFPGRCCRGRLPVATRQHDQLAADLSAMADALVLLAAARRHTPCFSPVVAHAADLYPVSALRAAAQVAHARLFAYVGTGAGGALSDREPARHGHSPAAVESRLHRMLVAVLGTTISPYLFFWQASQGSRGAARHARQRAAEGRPRAGARKHLQRIKTDTYVGMLFSNLIAGCIMLTTAATLHAAGVTDIQSAAQAAEALRPLAGPFAFALFAAGIIGTGLLAVPVLAAPRLMPSPRPSAGRSAWA